MIIDFEDFTKASNAAHCIQGSALLLFGAAEACALDNRGKKFTVLAAAALALSGAAIFTAVLALPGGWNFGQLSSALHLRRGFYLFIAFACLYCAAGLSRLTYEALDRSGAVWNALSLALLAFAGGLYFLMAGRVNEDAWRQVAVWHSAMGTTLLLAVAARTAAVFAFRRWLLVAWAVLLMATGLQLLTYKESRNSFSPRLVTMQNSPEAGPAVNGASAGKERGAAR